MAKKTEKKTRKGVFGLVRLRVSEGYVFPRSTALGIRLGLVLGLAFLAFYAIGATIGPRGFVSGGPLSSNHATFESQCWRCHQPFRSATDNTCSTCHEKFRDPVGTYSPGRHVLYGSVDLARIEASRKRNRQPDPACEGCHLEHRGREAAITAIDDRNCTGCHAWAPFASRHPEFQFKAKSVPDDATLFFTHIRHTRFVLKRLSSLNVEAACLYCHVPEADGASFQPISFDPHCGGCHLNGEGATPLQKLADPNDPSSVGVESLPMMQARGGALLSWASRMSPLEFNLVPARNSVQKIRIVHRDPWILENLRQLRARAYDSSVLGDLLDTDGTASNETVKDLGRDAVTMLRTALLPLRSRPEPEVRMDGATMDSLLAVVESRLKLPGSSGLEADFFARTEKTGVSAATRGGVEDLAKDLTGECRKCHVIRNAAVARVQKNQRSLTRAHFDHRAHILDRSCLDCHREIPVDGDSATAAITKDDELALFPASLQNLPGIDNCRDCHTDGNVSDRCVTCHFYHPDKSNRSNLLLTAQ